MALEDSTYDVLAPASKFIRTSPSNLGSPNKKRIRTIPFVIDTKGQPVTVTAYVDGVAYDAIQVTTDTKRTEFYYFSVDAFGVDVWLTLEGSNPFEFYGITNPSVVQELPIGKLFDQLGPIDFNREAKVRRFRLRILPTNPGFTYDIYAQDTIVHSGSFTAVANKDQSIEVALPKGIHPSILRIELKSPGVFHRFHADFKLFVTGAVTDQRWLRLK